MNPRTSASSKWRDRVAAAENERDQWRGKYEALLERLMGGLRSALEDGGYMTDAEHITSEKEHRA